MSCSDQPSPPRWRSGVTLTPQWRSRALPRGTSLPRGRPNPTVCGRRLCRHGAPQTSHFSHPIHITHITHASHTIFTPRTTMQPARTKRHARRHAGAAFVKVTTDCSVRRESAAEGWTAEQRRVSTEAKLTYMDDFVGDSRYFVIFPIPLDRLGSNLLRRV